MTGNSGSIEAKAIDDVRSLEDAYNVQVHRDLHFIEWWLGGGLYSIVAES